MLSDHRRGNVLSANEELKYLWNRISVVYGGLTENNRSMPSNCRNILHQDKYRTVALISICLIDWSFSNCIMHAGRHELSLTTGNAGGGLACGMCKSYTPSYFLPEFPMPRINEMGYCWLFITGPPFVRWCIFMKLFTCRNLVLELFAVTPMISNVLISVFLVSIDWNKDLCRLWW